MANEPLLISKDQFARVLSQMRDLEEAYQDTAGMAKPPSDRFELTTMEMRKLEQLVLDSERCIDIAVGLHKDVAQSYLYEASVCIEEGRFWLSKLKEYEGSNRFKSQQVLKLSTVKIELAQFWMTRALKTAREK